MRGTRLAIRKGLDLPLHEAEIMAEAFRERVVRTDDAKEGPRRFMEKRDPEWKCRVSTAFETILLDVDAADHVATITLNRPEVLNAFDRTMCEEMRDAWRIVKADDGGATPSCCGPPATGRSAPGSTPSSRYGQPDDVWNHEDPGELLSPKWQKVWKPVVCAVQGICTAGAFYFVNEADIVICSDDATFFDSHVTSGLVSALEPVGLMRTIGLGETLRIALTGNDERVSADTALRIGLVTEVVAADGSGTRAHEIAAASPPSRRPPRRARCARSGSRSTGPTAPHGAGPHLHAARQPDRHAEVAARGNGAPTKPRLR